MADERLLPPDALEKNALKEIPPLAGFWHRFGALAIDLIVIVLALWGSYSLLRPLYLAMGSATTAAGVLFVFLYVFLSIGPLGKGYTIGKAIVRIRVTDADGNPPGATAAALRAALMLVLLLPLLWGTIAFAFEASESPLAYFLIVSLTKHMGTAYVLANVFLVVLHPLNQTVHDIAAGTIVVREAGVHNLREFMEQIGGYVGPLQRRAVRVAAVAFAALSALGMFGAYRTIFSDEGRQMLRFVREFDREFAYDGFTPRFVPRSVGFVEMQLQRNGFTTATIESMYADAGIDGRPSTDTHVLAVEFRSSRRIEPEDMGTSAQLGALVARASDWARQAIEKGKFPLSREARTRGELIYQPRIIYLLFIEDINVLGLLFHRDRVVHAELAPIRLPEGFYEKEREAAKAAAAAAGTTTSTVAAPPTGAAAPPTTGTL